MNNWAELGSPFLHFNEEITQVWIENCLTIKKAKEWLEIGFNYQHSYFISWLRDENEIIAIDCWKKIDNNQKKNLVNKFDKNCREKDLAYCDWCWKMIKKRSMIFNDQENDLYFCLENCQNKFNSKNLSQNYLDKWYPQNGTCLRKNEVKFELYDYDHIQFNNFGKSRNAITHLHISGQNLTDDLYLSDFINLESLNCSNNNLSNLNLSNFKNLKKVHCYQNKLTNIFLDLNNKLEVINVGDNQFECFDYTFLNNETLKIFNIYNNNLEKTNISVFSKLINLETLLIYNNNRWIIKNKGNQFYGSFESLKDLNKLKELRISNTNINEGLEYLPESLEQFFCLDTPIQNSLNQWKITTAFQGFFSWKSYHRNYLISNWKPILEKKIRLLELIKLKKEEIIEFLKLNNHELKLRRGILEAKIESEYLLFSKRERDLFLILANAYQKYKSFENDEDGESYLKFKFEYDEIYNDLRTKLKRNQSGKNILETMTLVFRSLEKLYSNSIVQKNNKELIELNKEQLNEIISSIKDLKENININNSEKTSVHFKKITYNIQSIIGVENPILNDFAPMITDSSFLEKLSKLVIENENVELVIEE
ncbi:MAG: hypothetical protein AM1032_000342 [Mycoplasmataceae bacterium]|nr:MAG: hypothetical protein AM1032_000342 [Mycoplasmataceae bacterium]